MNFGEGEALSILINCLVAIYFILRRRKTEPGPRPPAGPPSAPGGDA